MAPSFNLARENLTVREAQEMGYRPYKMVFWNYDFLMLIIKTLTSHRSNCSYCTDRSKDRSDVRLNRLQCRHPVPNFIKILCVVSEMNHANGLKVRQMGEQDLRIMH